MALDKTFEKIRPYNDEEVPAAINRILNNGTFIGFIKDFFHTKNLPTYISQLKMVKSINDFQRFVIFPLTTKLIHKTTKGLIVKGLKNLDPHKKYLFISNHRDIILDSTFINYTLLKEGFTTTEIAIGSNLLLKSWITDLVKLNKSFVVKRFSSIRETLESSKHLSRYIRHLLSQNKNSVWLAQREGRTKDGNDSTQLSLLKMLNFSGEQENIENFKQLNIVPVSISYEFEPCDNYKIRELFLSKSINGYKKEPKDDLSSMFTGIITDKGRILLKFGKPLNKFLINIQSTDKKMIIEQLAKMLDYYIIKNYNLWPNNYIAYDIMLNEQKYISKYSVTEKNDFLNHLKKQVENIEGEKGELKKLFLSLYANPVINKKKLKDLKQYLHEIY